MSRRRTGILMMVTSIVGLVAAAYLAATKLAGEAPVCGPLRGCDTVAASPYSEVGGVPVAVLGVGFSIVVIGLVGWWWRTGSRTAVLAGYGLTVVGSFVVAALTYLELFVIHAVCVYCVTFGASVIVSLALFARAVRSDPGG